MTTVTNTFNRYCASVTNTSTSGIMASPVASNTDVVITGLVVANTSGTQISCDILLSKSGTNYYLIKGNQIPANESLIAIGWDQKVVLKTGDNIIVTPNSAGMTADVIMSTLEITTA